jgi:hypothetical protein
MKTQQKTKDQDRILELQQSRMLARYYVPIARGLNEYFTRFSLAKEFARVAGSTVKTLD